MKISIISFLGAFSFFIASISFAATGVNRHLLQVRVNNLDAIGEKIFPSIAGRLGLDRLRVSDQGLVDTSWNGYSVKVVLRDIRGSMPLSTAAPFTNGLRVGFAPGEAIGAKITAPDARVTMRLAVSIESSRWYQPGVNAEFTLTGHGFSGAAAIGLALANGDLKARSYAFQKFEISRVEIENIGLLSKVFGTVLRHTSMCGGSRSLEDCMTRTVNRQLSRMLTTDRILKPFVDPLLAEVSGAVRAIFMREDAAISSYATLESFATSGQSATFAWSLKLKPKEAPAACAASLAAPSVERRMSFDWSHKSSAGDFEVALPLSLFEDYLYAFARQGVLCFSGKTSYLGVEFAFAAAPVDAITISSSPAGELVLRIPLQASIASTSGQHALVEAKNLRAALELAFELESEPAKGLCLSIRRAALADLGGSVIFSGLHVPLLDLQGTLEDALNKALPSKLGQACFLPKVNPLNPFLSVVLGERAEITPSHAWSSFEFKAGDR